MRTSSPVGKSNAASPSVAGSDTPWCLVAVHGASAVNYVCHKHGRRRYATGDGSTNHPVLGVVLLGEGWHNNHHHYPRAARAGFFPGEVDGLYWMLRGLARIGLVWDLREVPERARTALLLAAPPNDPGGSLRRTRPSRSATYCDLPVVRSRTSRSI